MYVVVIGSGIPVFNSVPFSCCDEASDRPCIHMDMLSTKNRPFYNPINVKFEYSGFTVYTRGCLDLIEKMLVQPWTVIFIAVIVMNLTEVCKQESPPDGGAVQSATLLDYGSPI